MRRTVDVKLDDVERCAFRYFIGKIDPRTGLVRDNTRRGTPASIAGSGFALTCYAVGAERGYITRARDAMLTRRALRFLWRAPQGCGSKDTGCRGFFYHFLAPSTGRRVWGCEISTIDTTIAMAGVLAARQYFHRATSVETEIRRLADRQYRRVEWGWATAGGRTVSNGWCPETGFLPCRWEGYSEGLLLYILGLGSPTFPLPTDSYRAWTRTYEWRSAYGQDYLYAGPLFVHHLTQCWIDCRGIRDAFMRSHGIDYFENSRRATYVHQAYAVENPRGWRDYGELSWGITASDGPGPAVRTYHGERRAFQGYAARGAPFGPDDGTLSPWSVVASLPFAPEIVLPTLEAIDRTHPESKHTYGYAGSFNPSFTVRRAHQRRRRTRRPRVGWASPAHYAINQGPVVLMVENFRSGLVWQLMRECPYVVNGLHRAGYTGGWLRNPAATTPGLVSS